MPVPDNASSAFAGNGTTNHLAVDGGSAGVLSLSQSISASASDLKRPASAASSNNDGSQTLSQTKAAKTHYGKAARAFLAKDLQTALVQSQHAADLLLSSSQLGSSLTVSSFLDSDLDLQKLVDKVAILRLTVFTQVYTDKQVSDSIHDKFTQAKQQTSSTTSSDRAAIDRILLLLSKQPQSLISHLWFEALRLCTHTSGENDAPSLDPTTETMHLAIELSASVISSAVLAALRLDALNPAARTGSNAARLIAEWYLALFSSAFGAAPPTPKAAAAYEKIVGLYSLHVLASRLDEWEYAREFVGYSSLAESVKFGLLEQINEAQAHLTGQSEREQEAVANAQKTYVEEKAKRAAEEKQAKEAAASKSGSKSGSKARDLASGIGNFLTGKKEQVEATAGGGKASANSRANGSSSGSSGSGSDSGTRSSRRQRCQSPAYFSPRNGTGESSASCSTSPAISPGSTRSVESASKQSTSKDERRSLRRSSVSRSSDYDGGNESSTSVASNHSRRSARKEAASATEAAPTAGKEARTKDDTSYASTRAHLSRYIEGDHGHNPSAASNRRNSERDLTWKRPSGNSILSSITSMFDFRKASQTRTWLMSTIVMMIAFYRVARRPPAAASNAAGRARRNAAAQDARSKLVGKHASAGGGVIGINWLFLVWRKVMDTIRMGTQVTYL
ncbi:uncharacterized protein UBRO_04694 [Ustilago bromivora]|uniref:Uncharacterized protein n=2 Tax=Ustilago bromivora TaxID=307758 RepID=A0A1K0HDD2_9BASI|nr:uncharacterized protein UBRO_04694 [Ustilago bromivora]